MNRSTNPGGNAAPGGPRPHARGHVNGYDAYQALIGLGELRLSEIVPFLWGDPSWGLDAGSFATAVAKITRHR